MINRGLFEDDPEYMNTPACQNYCRTRQNIAAEHICNPSKVTLPFRVIRFALHLIKIKQSHILWKSLWSGLWDWLYLPWFISSTREANEKQIIVQTNYSVAVDSPDCILPWGATRNNITNLAFVGAMTKRYGTGSFLDLGCSSGKLVYDFSMVGWVSVGLDGCDKMKNENQRYWNYHLNLHTCDISKPFTINHKFEVITAWDVLEHLSEDGLKVLVETVKKHLTKDGIFVVTIANNSDAPLGIELHQTQWSRKKWVEFFISNGFCILPRDYFIKRHQMVRHSADGCEFVLSVNKLNL